MAFDPVQPPPGAVIQWKKEKRRREAVAAKATKQREDARADAVKYMPEREAFAVQYIDRQLSQEDAEQWCTELEARIEVLVDAFNDYRAKYGLPPKEIGGAMMWCAEKLDELRADLLMERLWPKATLQRYEGVPMDPVSMAKRPRR